MRNRYISRPGGEVSLEQTPGDDRHTSHRTSRSHRSPSTLSPRVLTGGGLALALLGLGIAVGVGAVPTPLTASSSRTPDAAILDATPGLSQSLTEASASPLGYALAKMPAHKATATPKPTPHKTITPTPTESLTTAPPSSGSGTGSGSGASNSGLTPQNTAEYETPSGQNQLAWSEAILTSLGAPITSANVLSIGYWMQNEAGSPPYGIVGANNPINVSQACCGGVPIQDDGDGVTFLQSYPTAADGIEAITDYLERGNYTDILAALKEGVGLSGSNLASEISLYSGGTYTTIPDSYGASQGQPETP